MPKIFDYLDYRQYLRDYYQEQKGQNPRFSYEMFTRKIGFKSKSQLHHIIGGKRGLSLDGILRVGRAMNLGRKELLYFQEMVQFCQVRDADLKAYHFERLCEFAPRNQARQLQQEHYEYFSKWYFSTVRELVCMCDLKDDYTRLGKMVKPAITAEQAKRAVDLLEKLGLITRTRSGYRQTSLSVTTGDQVRSLAVADYHSQNADLAKLAIDETPPEERDITSLTMSLAEETFAAVKAEILACRRKVTQIANAEAASTRIYHLNFHLFPTSVRVNQQAEA